jgi:hypothetical protein
VVERKGLKYKEGLKMGKTVLSKNGVMLVNASTAYEVAWFVYDGCDLVIGDVSENLARKIFEEVVEDKAPAAVAPVVAPIKKAAKVWTKDEIKNIILTNDQQVGKMLVKLWELQTQDEQRDNQTKHHNGVGFNGLDASILSSFAKWFQKTGRLSDKQLVLARKKLVKYAGQLTNIANGTL